MFPKISGPAITVTAGVLCLLLGVFIGQNTNSVLKDSNHRRQRRYTSLEDEEGCNISLRLVQDNWKRDLPLKADNINLVNITNLRDDLKELSRRPHMAATPRDEELARLIQRRFVESGFDTSELVPYEVLFSFPNRSNPNLITITDGSGNIVFRSKFKEEVLHEGDDDPEFVHAFSAYTPSGDVKTAPGIGVVYVNYGRVEDFDKLKELGIDVTGHIVMARYGKIYRGNKLIHAEQRGAKGIIMYSDPRDVALEGVEPQEVYPNTFWLPGSGMQRGRPLYQKETPLTPGWPSTEHAYRISEKDADFPRIPCQPIGYDDAKVIFEKLGGQKPPKDWVGGLEGLAYNLGPQMTPEFRRHSIRLQSHNRREIRRSYNVVATIRGEVEPDRYVLMGNHRDAWGYGAADPSSGTAQMLETARVLGELMKDGWRPRRTLVFCSWGAEEFGMLGSTEWVEEHLDKLTERSVLYINTDICASGPIMNVPSSPLVWDAILEVSKLVPGVRNGETIYDELVAYYSLRNQTSPAMTTLGGGSDYGPFSFYCGIPSLDIWFKTDKNKYDISIYPSYHTGYETFYMMEKHIDPGFRIIQGCSRMALLTLKYFGDSVIIPYSLERFPEAAKKALDSFKDNGARDELVEIYDKYYLLEESVNNFTVATSVFANKVKTMESSLKDPIMIRAINDQMMKLEQVFVLPAGLPGRSETRHAIFAPSQFDGYDASGFPGISDLLYEYNLLRPGDLRRKKEEEIKRHISDVTILFQRATGLLEDFHII
ncbi:LOW QUALITY PROTEIN: N-acetylated-alpha-linked acidic dipeptidase 2-like [Palaemon carinicauda]|uniref:LOW QUALITY PROTEIN: N-acetylated-alpha-linked acidic dipeptidase 2-like n=1 Tax=Palaemon carinicauda TaxID=392227 RepID=UPI0035B64E93